MYVVFHFKAPRSRVGTEEMYHYDDGDDDDDDGGGGGGDYCYKTPYLIYNYLRIPT